MADYDKAFISSSCALRWWKQNQKMMPAEKEVQAMPVNIQRMAGS